MVMSTKKASAVLVMTARGPDRILQEGGSQAWVLNPVNAAKHEYLVTVQNQHNGKWGGASEPHGTAFLIGRIRDVVPSREEGSQGRFMIRISEYARISIHYEWKGRNPVKYITLDEIGIDPDTLQFQPMPAVEDEDEEVGDEWDPASAIPPNLSDIPVQQSGLTIPEAKAGLAATLGVSVDKIEITIKA